MLALSYEKLEELAVSAHLSAVPLWSVVNAKLTRTFIFGSYKEGLVFAVAVGYLSDQLGHHPDIEIGYQKVTIATETHDAGGLTTYDFELARRIDHL